MYNKTLFDSVILLVFVMIEKIKIFDSEMSFCYSLVFVMLFVIFFVIALSDDTRDIDDTDGTDDHSGEKR